MKNKPGDRFWEIDFLRGIAIIMMIIYHFFYDLNFFNVYNFALHSTAFNLFLYPIGSLFLLLVGISLTLSYNKSKNSLTKKESITKFLLRGLKIFALGLIITLATWIYLGEGYIVFGVLHCIGLSIILSAFFVNKKYLNLILGLILIITGIFLQTMTFDFNYLLWLGLMPENFYTVDYFPLLPWFGVVLIGIALGNILYSDYKRRFNLVDMSYLKIIKVLGYLGRNSLIIYFLHQPILIGLINLYSWI